MIGGYITHYFKTKAHNEMEIRAPNSKKLSLREPGDITAYCKKFKPDFIINSAIASIDSDPELTLQVNYLGSINLARVAVSLNIPYIYISTAATLPPGENLTEEDHLPLNQALSNYAKSKLMTELTLRHMHETQGLDYTIIRMAIVYGEHDHKIQGVQRLLFSIVDDSMPFLLTKKGVRHSYSNANKLPCFVHHIIENRKEFSGQLFNFVDPEPVELHKLILKIKALVSAKSPREIYIPYPVAKLGKNFMNWLFKYLSGIGVKARLPAELMFLDSFYRTQTLSAEKLKKSSFTDPNPEASIYTELPAIIQYYLTRWEHLNLIPSLAENFFSPEEEMAEQFLRTPGELMNKMHREHIGPLSDLH